MHSSSLFGWSSKTFLTRCNTLIRWEKNTDSTELALSLGKFFSKAQKLTLKISLIKFYSKFSIQIVLHAMNKYKNKILF